MLKKLLFTTLAICLFSLPVFAAGEYKKPEDMDWKWEGLLGTYDKAALQRGYQVYQQVCAACHSMDYLYYRHLRDIGYNEEEVKAIASQCRRRPQ